MVPFQVVELGNIPEMLRDRYQSRNNSAASSRRGYQRQWPPPTPSEDHTSAAPAPSKLVRTKYGAWYLPPRTWKLRRKDEVSSRSLSRPVVHQGMAAFVFRRGFCCSIDVCLRTNFHQARAGLVHVNGQLYTVWASLAELIHFLPFI